MPLETQTQDPAPNQAIDFNESGLRPTTVIRTETILSKLPVHNLAKKGRVNIEISRKNEKGEVELKWEVSYNERYGQARQLAYKLDTIVIDHAIEEAGRPLPERICLGSLNQIAQELGVAADHGTTSGHLKRAFRQNALAGITAKFKYKGNEGTERTLEATFTRYSVIFTGEKFSDGTKADSVYIELNPTYREVLNNAPMRPLNLAYKKQLTPTAQRFYEIVSYKIFAALKYNHPQARLSYSEYCECSTQQRYFDYDHFKKQMYKIHRPHLTSGYISEIKYDQATDEQGRTNWIMCYVPGPKARAEFATFTGKQPRIVQPKGVGERKSLRPRQRSLQLRLEPLQPQLSEVDTNLLSALTSRGVTDTEARKILANLPASYQVLDVLEWGDLQIRQSPTEIKNPPGFLISLIHGRLTPPTSFETSRQKTARLEAIAAQEQRQQEAQLKKHGEEEAARQRGESRYNLLTSAQQKELQQIIQAELFREFPFLASQPNASSIHEGAIRARIYRYLSQPMELLVVPLPYPATKPPQD